MIYEYSLYTLYFLGWSVHSVMTFLFIKSYLKARSEYLETLWEYTRKPSHIKRRIKFSSKYIQVIFLYSSILNSVLSAMPIALWAGSMNIKHILEFIIVIISSTMGYFLIKYAYEDEK